MITHAFVKSINKDGTVIVGCDDSACQGCHAQMFCNNKNHTEYLARNDKKLQLEIGDEVELFLPPGKTIFSTFLVFAFPLVMFLVGYIVSGFINKSLATPLNEIQRALCGIGAMALAFLIATLLNAHNKMSLMPIVKEIISSKDSMYEL